MVHEIETPNHVPENRRDRAARGTPKEAWRNGLVQFLFCNACLSRIAAGIWRFDVTHIVCGSW
jgi:hypothetical protein